MVQQEVPCSLSGCRRFAAFRSASEDGRTLYYVCPVGHATTEPGQLPTAAPYARRTDPPTSHAAAASITEDALRRSQKAVLSFLRSQGPTADARLVARYEQIYEVYGWPKQSPSGLRTRRRELTDAGLVKDTGDRVRLDSGRNAIVWSAA